MLFANPTQLALKHASRAPASRSRLSLTMQRQKPAAFDSPWVVPAVDVVLCDQLVELAFAEHCVGDVEPAVLPHDRLVQVQHIQQPDGS